MGQPELVDYYALLGVERDADKNAIEAKIRQLQRTWIKRTGLPDLEKRQEAERKVRQLGEARGVLLDNAARQAYDQQLATAPRPNPADVAPAAPSATGDWLVQAHTALSVNDYFTAAYAAREARRTVGNTVEVWSLLAQANAGLGRYEDAMVEAQHAARLEPGDPDHHLTLAGILESLGNWEAARQSYEAAVRLDPHSDAPKLGVASTLMGMGRTDEAIALLEELYAVRQDTGLAGDYLAMALLEAVERVPRVQGGDSYVITSSQEIDRMRTMLARARQVAQSPDLTNGIVSAEDYVNRCAGRTFLPYRLTGFLGRTLGVALLILLCIGSFSNDLAMFSVVLVLGGAGLAWHATVPRWKINKWAHQEELARSGVAWR
ncbi:MAG TPA: tetratricopeptide repeat protein [Micromonosporaceae bacterium]